MFDRLYSFIWSIFGKPSRVWTSSAPGAEYEMLVTSDGYNTIYRVTDSGIYKVKSWKIK